MAATTVRERTIAFYEIVDLVNADQVRVKQRDWQAILGKLALAKIDDRTCDTADQTLIGTVHDTSEINNYLLPDDDRTDYLLLHKVKGEGEWLSTMNLQTGEWRELELRAAEGYLDTSVIAFLDFGNVVGLMQGSVGAPTHKALENWINKLELFTKPVVVRPLMTRAEVERLAKASGASRVEIQLGSHKAETLSRKHGRLARMLRTAAEDFEDVRITVTISVPPGGARGDDRRKLLEDLDDLADVMPNHAKVAKANLVYADPNGGEYRRLSEFVEHHITAKRRVPTTDEHGNAVRILSAVQVIMDASAENEDELRRAADVQE